MTTNSPQDDCRKQDASGKDAPADPTSSDPSRRETATVKPIASKKRSASATNDTDSPAKKTRKTLRESVDLKALAASHKSWLDAAAPYATAPTEPALETTVARLPHSINPDVGNMGAQKKPTPPARLPNSIIPTANAPIPTHANTSAAAPLSVPINPPTYIQKKKRKKPIPPARLPNSFIPTANTPVPTHTSTSPAAAPSVPINPATVSATTGMITFPMTNNSENAKPVKLELIVETIDKALRIASEKEIQKTKEWKKEEEDAKMREAQVETKRRATQPKPTKRGKKKTARLTAKVTRHNKPPPRWNELYEGDFLKHKRGTPDDKSSPIIEVALRDQKSPAMFAAALFPKPLTAATPKLATEAACKRFLDFAELEVEAYNGNANVKYPYKNTWIEIPKRTKSTTYPTLAPAKRRYDIATAKSDVKLYCSKCMRRDKICCVASGYYACEMNSTKADLTILQVFAHDVECHIEKENQSTNKLPVGTGPGYMRMQFNTQCLEEETGTYDATVTRLKTEFVWEAPKEFHRSDEQPNASNNHPWKYEVDERTPPGVHINFGKPNYWFDDRLYELIPSPNYPEIDTRRQLLQEARILYRLATRLNFSDEVNFYVPDYDHIYQEGQVELNYCPLKRNPSAHLYINETSLLLGGHNMTDDLRNPVHQICHMDFAEYQNQSFRDVMKGLFLPGSWILPLDTKRSIYIGAPHTTLEIEKGELLFFFGDLPHGGITYNGVKDSSWRPALHGHLDSIMFERKPNDVAHFVAREDHYLPEEHLQYLSNQQFYNCAERIDNMHARIIDLHSNKIFAKKRGNEIVISKTKSALNQAHLIPKQKSPAIHEDGLSSDSETESEIGST